MLWRLRDRSLDIGHRALILGIVNATPDSFSDGGRFFDTDAAVAHALTLVDEGADLLDIGGESTRPGAEPVPLDEELRRVVPVVRELRKRTETPISVDTYKAEVARQCLALGAQVINDVTALTGDPDMPAVIQRFQPGVILMHMQGTPRTMQIAPHYDDVIRDIRDYLRDRVDAAVALGLPRDNIAVDPGVGFGKTREHCLELLARLAEFRSLGRPLCLGVSRKGFVGKVVDRPEGERLIGSLAIVADALAREAAQIVRVHDVRETRDVVRIAATLNEWRGEQDALSPGTGL
ncbi:MAG: dihydropteroate synthase [Gemmataceae bacterium]